jgi:urease accessory protein
MTTPVALTRLLQLASPALPVGAFSYSQGLEAAVEAGMVRDEASAGAWIADVLDLTLARLEAPLFLRLYAAWSAGEGARAREWNEMLLASRETAELRAEAAQMGYSLVRLLAELGKAHPFDGWDEVAFASPYTWWAWRSGIGEDAALVAYLWSWAENQVMAAVKSVPLGQSAGQRLLAALGPRVAAHAAAAHAFRDDDIGGFAPALAVLSSHHETQYSRLFRS